MSTIASSSSTFKPTGRTYTSFSNVPTEGSLNAHLSRSSAQDPLKRLQVEVAPNAIMNAGGRADEVRCHPGTREEVIRQIERWIYGQVGVTSNMMWLSGPAGAGKSAIVQTIAERCKEQGVQAASFFFFRADSTRNTAQPLVATLLHQIFEFHPPARRAVATALADNPLLLRSSTQVQFNKLLSAPVQHFPPSLHLPSRRPIVLLIDGLDECDSGDNLSQAQIIHALDRLVTQNNSPFLVLVASRPEPRIMMAFNGLTSGVESVFLGDEYNPEHDILLFVTAQFESIQRSHPSLSLHWPSQEDIDFIVKNSSGQFIFAATVMRYLATSAESPILSLEKVKCIMPTHISAPFARLDAIYTFILSQANNLDTVLNILSMRLLFDALSVRDIVGFSYISFESALRVYNAEYTPEFLLSSISNLTAIMHLNNESLVFYHASLPDFLQDQSRAGRYYIDIDVFGAKILPAIWMKVPESLEMAQLGLYLFNALKTPTPEITKTILSTPSTSMQNFILLLEDIHGLDLLLGNIYRHYYADDPKIYRQMILKWMSWYINNFRKADLKTLQNRSLPHVEACIRRSRLVQSVTGLFALGKPGNQ